MVQLNKLLVGALWAFHQCNAFSPAGRSLVRVETPKKSFRGAKFFATTVSKEEVVEEEKSASILDLPDSHILGQPTPYDQLTIGVMKETYNGENRVSQTPDSVKMLIKEGFHVVVQAGGKSEYMIGAVEYMSIVTQSSNISLLTIQSWWKRWL